MKDDLYTLVSLFTFLIQNLDDQDRYMIFQKYKNDIKKLVSYTSFKKLENEETHLSNNTILRLIYIRKEAFEYIKSLYKNKIIKIKASLKILNRNRLDFILKFLEEQNVL